jgi:hypothetical protein
MRGAVLRRPGLRSYGMSGPILCLDLWYVWSYPMPASVLRPASGFYVFRPITSNVGLRASVWSTQDHTRPPLGGVAPRQAEVPTGGTHTPVFDITVRSGRDPGATVVCTRGELCGAQAERRRPSSWGPFRKWECERRRKYPFRPIRARGRRRSARRLLANGGAL